MNHCFKNEKGNRFGRLVAISFEVKNGKAYWLCKCDCGNTKVVAGDKLRSGNTVSCGCYQKECRGKGKRTHGMTDSRLYYEWSNMKSRCLNPKNIMYSNYGARGITVCEDWKDFLNFAKWSESNGYSESLTLERIDVNGNYCPENCCWIPRKEQCLNRTDSHKITAFGKTQTIKEWSDETGLKYDTIHARIQYYGWSAEEALTKPPR